MTNSTDDFEPEVFDHTGQIAPKNEEDHARMSPERQAIYDNLHAAIANERAKESAVKDAVADHKRKQAMADLAQIALTKLTGKIDFMDEWRRTVARVEAQPDITNDKGAAIKAAREAYDIAQENVQISQQAITAARHAIAPARALVANALRSYTARFPVLTGVEAVKAHIDKLQEHKQTAKENYEAVERQIASVLDAHLSMGKGSPAIRSSRQAQRGAFPSSMLNQKIDPRQPIDNRGSKRS